MNQLIRTALILIAFASVSSYCFAQTGKPPDEPPPPPAPAVEYSESVWKEFSSAEGRFSVRMPTTPKLNQKEIDSPFGKLPIFIYVAETSAGGYMVGYNDFPKFSDSPDFVSAVLRGARDNVLAVDASRKLLSDNEITVDGYTGREWLIADSHLLFRAETFMVKGRLYQILSVAPLNVAFSNGRAGERESDRTKFYEDISRHFFGSFKLLPTSGGTGDSTQAEPILAAPNGITIDPDITDPKKLPTEPKTEGEVDRLLKSLREKGEPVYVVCAEGTKCQPSPDVSGAIPAGKAANIHVITNPQPEYPLIAKAARAQGTVVVQAVVDEEGKVIAAQALSGNPLLQAAAVKASREARFTPILIEGKPVKVVGTISYNFELK